MTYKTYKILKSTSKIHKNYTNLHINTHETCKFSKFIEEYMKKYTKS